MHNSGKIVFPEHPMIQLTGAGKRFGPKLLFEDLDWLITPNERVGIVGANGTGKSTLLQDAGRHRVARLRQHHRARRASPPATCRRMASRFPAAPSSPNA